MRGLRLCLVSEIFHPEDQGGQGSQAYDLATRLRARGAHVLVITRRNFRSTPSRERCSGLEIIRLPPSGLLKGAGWRAVGRSVAFLLALTWQLLRRARQFDVVLVQGAKMILLPTMFVGALTRTPCVVKIDALAELEHAIDPESLRKMKLAASAAPVRAWTRLRNRLLRSAAAIVALTESMEDALVRRLGDDAPVHRIPNGIALERRSGTLEKPLLRRRLGLPDGVLFVYTGRLARSKGLHTLLDAWQPLAHSRDDVTLLLIGSGERSFDGCETELRQRVSESGLANRVLFVGQVTDVAQYLQASDVFVFPSESEGFGLSLVEAMAAGLPCVSTRVGVAAEIIIEHERDGWLVPVGDAAALGQALQGALSERERWTDIGRAVQAKVAVRFDMNDVAQRFEALLVNVVASARNPRSSIAATVGRNAGWLLACRLAADTLNLALFILLAHTFGTAGIGVYAYGFAIAGLIYGAATMGIDEYGVREYVRREGYARQQLMAQLLGLQCWAALLASVLLIAYLAFTNSSASQIAVVAALTCYQLCAAFATTLFIPSMAQQRMVAPALTLLASRALGMIAAGAVALAGGTLFAVVSCFAASGLVLLFVAMRSLLREAPGARPQMLLANVRMMLGKLWSFGAVDVLGPAILRASVIVLMLRVGAEAAGIYAAGLKLVEVACLPLLFIGQAVYPGLISAFNDPALFRTHALRFAMSGALLSAAIAASFLLLAPVVAPWFNVPSLAMTAILAPLAVLLFLQCNEIVFGRLLLAADVSIPRAVANALGLVCAVVIAVVATPHFGVGAAVISAVIALLIVNLYYAVNLFPFLQRRTDARLLTPPAV